VGEGEKEKGRLSNRKSSSKISGLKKRDRVLELGLYTPVQGVGGTDVKKLAKTAECVFFLILCKMERNPKGGVTVEGCPQQTWEWRQKKVRC